MIGSEEFKVTYYCCSAEGCNKEYKNKFNLKRHMQMIHLGKKPFCCKICNQSFVSKQNLREHAFIHSGIKPYKCSYCGKKFRQISQHSLHKRKHKKNYAATLQYAVQIEKAEESKN